MHAVAQTLSSRVYTVMHMAENMIGARCRCSVVLILGHCRQWGHRFGVRRPRLRLFLVIIDCYTLPHFPNQ